jgi:D-serine deaminase-like pyridoxal phosphate-dependent protein
VIDLQRPVFTPWHAPAHYWPSLTAAVQATEPRVETPVGIVQLDAFAHNAHSMLDRAAGTTIRVASKSVRVRELMDAVLALPGYSGVLAYTAAEALWLAESIDDVVVGYPTADRTAIAALGASDNLAPRVTLMVDSIQHLDFIDAVVPASQRHSIRVCLELDVSYETKALGHVGVWRSPVRTVAQAAQLARHIVDRPGFTLVGIMGYEAQIAGVGNRPKHSPGRSIILDWMQTRSVDELAERRGAVVDAVSHITPLEFVNGGGTGSLESTSADPSVTEIAAGSGLLGGHLFDTYSRFRPAPAAAFALSTVRKPTPAMATVLGGGWIASGPAQPDRLPEIVWPTGLTMQAREMAGEVQTPLTGSAAARLQVGDLVWFRHTKSGELSEHLNEFQLVRDGSVVGRVPTYRGEGKAFL